MANYNQRKPVLVVGAGIGGLSAAIALGQRGFAVHLLERSEGKEESGAGIQLGPNATRVLHSLGVLDSIERSAVRPAAIRIFDALSGKSLSTMPLGPKLEGRYGAPYLVLHREDLHTALSNAALQTEGVTLQRNFEAMSIEDRHGTIAASGMSGIFEGAALIGADGLWSAVRQFVAPGAMPVFAGQTAWRTLLPMAKVPPFFAEPSVGLWLAPRAHLVHYPVRGGTALNIVVVTEGGEAEQGWERTADISRLFARIAAWSPPIRDLLSASESSWRVWSLFSMSPLQRWHRGRVALIGDAAHPVLPFLAQGAGLAIEDAFAVAKALIEQDGDPRRAFPEYERRRRARAARVQRRSLRMGRFYHLGFPLRQARNLALRLQRPEAHLGAFDWLYAGNI